MNELKDPDIIIPDNGINVKDVIAESAELFTDEMLHDMYVFDSPSASEYSHYKGYGSNYRIRKHVTRGGQAGIGGATVSVNAW